MRSAPDAPAKPCTRMIRANAASQNDGPPPSCARGFVSALTPPSPVLAEHMAEPPLGHRHHPSDVVDTAPSARGAQKFPLAASCRISLSSVEPEIARRSRDRSAKPRILLLHIGLFHDTDLRHAAAFVAPLRQHNLRSTQLADNLFRAVLLARHS